MEKKKYYAITTSMLFEKTVFSSGWFCKGFTCMQLTEFWILKWRSKGEQMKKVYHVKLIMSEEYIINADSEEEAEKEARDTFGCNYYIDEVEVTERKKIWMIEKSL